MKKIIVLFLFISTLSYSQFSIKGTMTSTQNSSWVLLYKIEGTKQSFIKNTQIRKEDKKGFFEFSLPNGAQKGTYRIKFSLGKNGFIDFLFNNGGLSQRSRASDTSLELDRKIMEINYFGNIALTKAVLPYMQNQKSGHIVVISSIVGKFGFFLRSSYSASKHALHGFYESLHLEEEKNRLRVTIVCPGKIQTNISLNALNSDGLKHGLMDNNQKTGMSVEDCVRKLLNAVMKNKKEIFIGNKEIKAVTLKKFFPNFFWKILRKQSIK